MTFTCPMCGYASRDPFAVRERWCKVCGGHTGQPPPEGKRWVLFKGGELDGRSRLVDEPVKVGDTFSRMYGSMYRFDGARFVVS